MGFVQHSLNNFIYQCDSVLADLYSAQNAEMMDSATSNYSLVGFLISNHSYYKNSNASEKVNELQNRAIAINQQLSQQGIFQRGIAPLPTDFNGIGIMQSENAEHSWFGNWLTSGRYSSFASVNTLQQINHTIAKVNQVRMHAAHLANVVGYVPNSCPCP